MIFYLVDLLNPMILSTTHTLMGGRMLENIIVSTNGIFPCLTTRPDTLGVVVNEQE